MQIMQGLKKNQALLIKSDANRFYLTGFKSSAGSIVITKSKAIFFIDFRYFEKAKAIVKNMDVVLSKNLKTQIAKFLEQNGIIEMFVETNTLSLDEYGSLCKDFKKVKVKTDSKFTNLIAQQRSIKTDSEISNIKIAQNITDKTFSYILNNIKVGRTEKEIMLDMEFYLRKLGSDGVSFDFIVASGKNSSQPHAVPTDKKIEQGDFVTMDFGAVVNGYRSDMTRTVAVGYATEQMQTVYNTVLKAQIAAINAIKSGETCKDIDKVARDIIYNAGYKNCFGHGLGHSVGIEIHENPCFNLRDKTKLKSGMIMTVEPGIYLESKFGVRIEDMVIVTDSGFENITKSDKKLIIL